MIRRSLTHHLPVSFSLPFGSYLKNAFFRRKMATVESLVHRVRDGDIDAYETLVLRFQDMAVGYGYSILRDFQLAQDAAQEAFFEAYRNLHQLREPAAFPGWFRRIVFKQCDRLTRGGSLLLVPLEAAEARASNEPAQADAVEKHEMQSICSAKRA